MRLTLALPDLLTLDRDALGGAPALALLAHYAGAPTMSEGSLDRFLWSSAATSPVALAPLAALGAGFDPGTTYVLRADPVSLVAGRNDVALAARIDDLGSEEAESLLAALDAHFHGDGLRFIAPRPDAWFVTVDAEPRLATTPLAMVRGAIYPFLPAGDDAPQWRRWMSEMQMLLHEHPVNRARERRGQLAVTGIWISDGGRATDGHAPLGQVFAAPGTVGDVLRGIARRHRMAALATPTEFATLPTGTDAVVILPRAHLGVMEPWERAWLGPAVVALESGRLTALSLLADGHGLAAAWHTDRPHWIQRTRGRFTRPAFVPPKPDLGEP
jgi:hypothetical protein